MILHVVVSGRRSLYLDILLGRRGTFPKGEYATNDGEIIGSAENAPRAKSEEVSRE